MGFLEGLKISIETLRTLLWRPRLRAWFFRSALRTVCLALVILLSIFGIGAWTLWSQLGQNLWAGLGIAAYLVVFSLVAGTLSSVISNALVLFVAGEKSLLIGLAESEKLSIAPIPFAIRKKEIRAMFVTLLVSLFFWPLLLLPFTLPFGILIFAWAMGREAFVNGEKHWLQIYGESPKGPLPIGKLFYIGMAIVPAVMGLFPLFGWLFLPMLPVSGFIALQRIKQKSL